jgi:hypothetical protein
VFQQSARNIVCEGFLGEYHVQFRFKTNRRGRSLVLSAYSVSQ